MSETGTFRSLPLPSLHLRTNGILILTKIQNLEKGLGYECFLSASASKWRTAFHTQWYHSRNYPDPENTVPGIINYWKNYLLLVSWQFMDGPVCWTDKQFCCRSRAESSCLALALCQKPPAGTWAVKDHLVVYTADSEAVAQVLTIFSVPLLCSLYLGSEVYYQEALAEIRTL